MPDPCENEMQAYAEASAAYVEGMIEAAIQYAESLQASENLNNAWNQWVQADENLTYCRNAYGYGARQESERVKLVGQLGKMMAAARKAAGVEFVERITDALGEPDGKFSESQKLRLTEAREVLMKAMR